MLLRGSYSSADGLVGNRLPGTTSFCAAPKQPPELHSAGVVGSGWPRAARGSSRTWQLAAAQGLQDPPPGSWGTGATMGKAPWLALASPSAESGGHHRAATSRLHRLVSIPCPGGHAAKEGAALFHLVGRQIWEGRKCNPNEAKALEKAVGVHRETKKCPRKDVPGWRAVLSWCMWL